MRFCRSLFVGLILSICAAAMPVLAQDTPVIGVAKNATISGRTVILDFYLEAFGDVGLENLSLDDDLDAVFGAGNYSITVPPALTDNPGTITLNGSYDGSTDIALLSSGTLALGATAQISMEIEILTLSDQGFGSGIYHNQVQADAESPLGTPTSDLSDDGTDPDPNENDDPTDVDEDDVTIMNFNGAVENPRIGVAKRATPSGNQVTLDFFLENFGDVTLSNLAMPDDLDRVFGFGNYSVLSGPSLIDDPGTITVNMAFDGSADAEIITSGTLSVGDTAQIQIVVDVTNITDQGLGLGVYQNQVTAFGNGPGGGSSSDLSDNGSEPDPSGNGNPTETGEDDPTVFVMGEEPVIGLSKTASSSGNFVTLDFYLENLGNVDLDNLSIIDDLDATFGAGNYLINSGPTLIVDPGTLSVNAGFDGSSDQNLIASGTLDIGDLARIQVVVEVYLADVGFGFGDYVNQASASGEAPGGGVATDLSDDGADPDPNGNSNPDEMGENDPTAFSVAENPVLGVAKDSLVSGSTVDLIFVVENLGNVTVSNLSMIDDLNSVFGAGNYVISGRSITSSGSATLNNAFNGSTNQELMGGSLVPSDSVEIIIRVFVTNFTDQGFGVGVYQNQVTATGDSPLATPVSDMSHQGMDPDPNGNGDPTEAGENDPTEIIFGNAIGIAKDVSININEVTFDLYLENFSGGTLSNLDLDDNLGTVFGEGNYTVTTLPFFIDDPGTIVLNGAYDGSGEPGLISSGTLNGLDTAQIRFVVTVDLVESQGSGMGVYSNQVTVFAERSNGTPVFDLSVNGVDPDTNGDDDPAESSATPIVLSLDALIGAGKVASVTGNQITIDFYLENFGVGTGSSLSMSDDLDAVFGAGNYTVSSAPAIVGSADGIVLNVGFDGSTDTEILDSSSTLASGSVVQIQIVVDITNPVDMGSGVGIYENQVTIFTTDSNGITMADLSDNNTNPDINGDNDPTAPGLADPPVDGEDDPTEIFLGASSIGIAEHATVNGTEITFDYYLENLGDFTVSGISVSENLFGTFGFGNYSVVTQPFLVEDPGGVSVINTFDGTFQQTLVSSSSLDPGDRAQIRFVVNVTTVSNQGNGFGIYDSQATMAGSGPDAAVSDISDFGVLTDTDGDGNANEAGENDASFYVIGEEVLIGVALDATVVGQQITLDYYLENLGSATLSSLSLPQNLDDVFGAGNYSLNGAPAIISDPGGSLALNGGFDGTTDDAILSAASSLGAGNAAQIRVIVDVTTVANLGNGEGVYQAQTSIFGVGPTVSAAADYSDNGTDPDPNGNGNPADSGENDLTQFQIDLSVMGAAKAASVDGNQVTFNFNVENLGSATLSDVGIIDDLDAVFGAGNYVILDIISRGLAVNESYDGSTDTVLVSGESVGVGLTRGAEVVVEVLQLADMGSGLGVYSNQVTATATGLSDLSHNGVNPDPNGDNTPDEGDPTTFTISQSPIIGAAKTASVSGDDVTFDFYLANYGNVDLSAVTLTDNLDAVLGAGNYTVASAPSFIDDPGTLTLNASFNGSGDVNLISSGTLAFGDTAQIRTVVHVMALANGGSGLGVYSNQVSSAGQAPNGSPTSDISDSGSNPDPNGNNDPTETGENDVTPFTIAEDPEIGVALNISVSGSTATLNFYLENLGNVTISDLAIAENLDTLFGAGNYSLAGGPSLVDDPGTITVNGGYDGSSDTALITSGFLTPNDTAQIQITVDVIELIDGGSGLGVYSNQVTVNGNGSSGPVSDLSDSGTDPDPNGNEDPTEAGENDATPFTIAEIPVVGIAKNAGVVGATVTLDFYLENYGNVTLSNLAFADDLDGLFGAGNYSLTSGPTLIDDPGTITVNAGYDGSASTGLITSGTLAVGDTAQIRIVADVAQLIDGGSGLGNYSNQVTATADAPGGAMTSDVSDAGVDPDPNGNDDPTESGENDATSFSIAENPIIGAAKNAGVSGGTVTLDFFIENFGNVDLSNLSIPEDLDALFGAGNYTVASGPTLIDDPGTLTVNAAFDGSSDAELISSGTLGFADTAQIQITVDVAVLIDGGSGLGNYSNQVTASADAPGGAMTSDLSDSGTDPDPNGNADPTEAGENDATTFTISEDPIIGVAKNAGVAGSVVTFDFYLENFGNVDLSNMAITEDLDALFGSGNYNITAGPVLVDDPGTLTVNAGFDGSADQTLIDSGGLSPDDTAQIQLTVEIFQIIDNGSGYGSYSNQVTASADAPGGGMTSDLSDAGTDPDPNGNDDPTESGEDDATTFTVDEIPFIGLAKDASAVGNRVTLNFYIYNLGNIDLNSLELTDDLDAAFGAGNYSIFSGPAFVVDPGTVTLNTGFNGSGDQDLITSGDLAYEGAAQIQVVVDVTNVTDQGSGFGVYSNQALASAVSPLTTPVSDLSQNGSGPDPNENGDPTDDNETTPIVLGSAIGAAKSASILGREATLLFTVENLGFTEIMALGLSDDLDAVFGAGNYNVTGAPNFDLNPGGITLNPGFDGSSNPVIISGGTLDPEDVAVIRVVVEVTNMTDQGSGVGVFTNQVTVTAQDPLGGSLNDLSHNGADPDPNGNGDATEMGENEPTPINFAEQPRIGVAKNATLNGTEVTLHFYLENLGNVDLDTLSLPDNLDAVFGAGNYSITSAPSLIDDPGTLTANAGFNGAGASDLISSGSLNVGDTAQIQVVVDITNVTDQGAGLGVYSNQVTVSGLSPANAPVSDVSDNGVNPDPDGDGNPGGGGENDPTPIVIGEEPVIGLAKTATPSGSLLVLDFYLENLGNVDLDSLDLQDDLDAVFGAGNHVIINPPTLIDDPGTLILNPGFNGVGDTALISSGSLVVGDTAQIQVTVHVSLSDQGLGYGNYSNQAQIAALGPGGGFTSDLSDSGTDPDGNGNGNPNEAGENDPTTFNIPENAVIGVAKNAVVNADGLTTNLTFVVENLGNATLTNLTIPDDLDAVFGSGNYSITGRNISGPSSVLLNNSFNGSAQTDLLAGGDLAPFESATVEITLLLLNKTDQGFGVGTYMNQVTATGFAQIAGPVSDLSDQGSVPDANGNGDPSDAGEDDPTEILYNVQLGVAKDAAVFNSQVTLDFYLENFGGTTLSDISLADSLDQVFGAGNYFLPAAPSLIDDPGTLTLNPAFDGSSDPELLSAGSTLAGGDTAQIRVVVEISQVMSQGFGLGVYRNQVTATALNANGNSVFDVSDSGTDPDPDGNGNPSDAGESDPTEITLTLDSWIGAAKDASVTGMQVVLDFYLENFGTGTSSDVSLTDDLDSAFGAGNYSITSAPAVVGLADGIVMNGGYDGSADQELLDVSSTLSAGATVQIQMTVDVLTVTDQGLGFGVYENQALVTGTDVNGIVVADESDWDVDPDITGDGDPTFPGLADPPVDGENDPTIIIVGDAAIGLAKHATVSGTEVTMDFYIENLGTVALSDVLMFDNLVGVFGFGNFSIASPPVFIDDPGTLSLNTFFNGFNVISIVSSGTLDPGATAIIRVVVNVDNVTDQGLGLGVFNNQAEISALDPSEMGVGDFSDDGVLPDPNGNGLADDMDEDDPTLIVIGEEAIIGVAKDASVLMSQVTFNLYLENLGNVALSTITLTEDLDAVFGAGNYTLSGSPAIIVNPGGLVLNGAYDGGADTELMDASSTLGVGETAQVQVVVDVTTIESQGLGLGFYENQVLAGGVAPMSSLAYDFSDNGTDPDPNGNGFADDADESDPTPFVVEIRSIGAAKTATVNGNQVTFEIFLENLGSVDLTDVVVTEDLDAVFGAGNYQILFLVDPRAIANPAFDGSTNTTLVDNESLLVGQPTSIQIVVEVDHLIDQGSGAGVYSNQVTASATGTSDLSDSGTEPDANGNDDATDAGEDDPTVFSITEIPVIGGAKAASVSGNDVTFTFYLENFGNADLANPSIIEDLDALFGAGNYSVASGPTLVDDPGTLTVNAGFNGSGDQELISSGTLPYQDTASIEITVNVQTIIDSGSGLGVYSTQTTVSAEGLNGGPISDLTDEGSEPDANGDGDPTGVDEDDPTAFTISQEPIIGIAKTASVTGADVQMDFYLENLGNVTLSSLSIVDDLDTVFGAGTYTVSAAPSFIDDPGTITLNAGFDGSADTQLISSGTLASGDTAQIRITVAVFPLSDQGSGLGNYVNQVTASGQGPAGGSTSDVSDDGVDPDPNGNDDPTEAGEDDPTTFTIAQDPIIGVAKTVSIVTRTVTMDFYLENYGNVDLEYLSLVDDLDTVFGAGNYTVTSAPVLVSTPGTIVFNGGFDGSADNDLFFMESSLGVGESAQVRVVVEVTSVSDQGAGPGVYENLATASARSEDGTPTTDVSDDGTNPDPNGDGNPNEVGENDPTVIILRGTVGDFVWHDLNGDGVQDLGEPGIANVTLDLYRESMMDGGGLTYVGTQTTDANGAYEFDDVFPDAYQVTVTDTNNVLTNYVRTGGVDPHLISLSPGEFYKDADFGYCLPPEITVQPLDTEACNGTMTMLSLTATGSALSFQWYKDGNPIAGADEAELTFDPVSTSDAGLYYCEVTNGCGNETSVTVELTIYVLEVQFAAGSLAQGLNPMTLEAMVSCDFGATSVEWENLSTGEIFGVDQSTVTLPSVLEESTEFEVRVGDSLNDPVSARILILVPVLPFQLDYNEDGCNDIFDLLHLLPAWNITFIDPNGDGFVDMRDFLYINTYDQDCVPE